MQALDYEHALAEYRQSLKLDRHNPAALAGAGHGAFELGRYDLAQRYLEAAVAVNPNDSQSAELLKTAELVLQMDPFRRQISVSQRHRIVIQAFNAAGERLKSCLVDSSANAASQPGLAGKWAIVKPQITEEGLRRNPDLVEQAMNLVFDIERQTSMVCGPPTGMDLALFLISKLHEGN